MAGIDQGVVAIVGHEPQLGRLVTYLIGGVERSGVELKKGGACLIEFEGHPKVGGGMSQVGDSRRAFFGIWPVKS